MILNVLVIVSILISAAIWGSKAKGYGMFSGFLALCCTLAAGAIAFAAWEPVSLMLLRMGADGASFFDNLLQDSAWSFGLLFPFLISLLVLRLVVDSVVRSNMEFSDNANTMGGLAFGAAIGVLTMGIVVTGVGFLRLPPSILGYQPIEERQGSPVYARSLWIPVDRIVVGLYEKLSLGAFAAQTPLAHYRPQAHVQAGMQRMTFKGQSRVSIAPDQYTLGGRYIIEGDAETLLKDSFQDKTQKASYPDGSVPSGPSRLEGYVFSFESGAKEKGGVFTIAPGQLRLIFQRDGYFFTAHPVAVVAEAEAGTNMLYRFRFDAAESFIASVGGGSQSSFAFEFVIPQDAESVDLLVKNVRTPVGADAGLKERVFRTTTDRDDAVRDSTILTSIGVSSGSAAPLDTSRSQRAAVRDNRVENFNFSGVFPGGATLNKTNRGPLVVNEENEVIAGEHQISKDQMSERGLDSNLRVDSFGATRDTTVLQVALSTAGTRSIFGSAVEESESSAAPVIIDHNGTRYEPLGYYYSEGEIVRIRMSPGQPLRSITDAPTLSRTKRDQTLVLIYRPTRGVRIVSFVVGDKELVNFGSGVQAPNR